MDFMEAVKSCFGEKFITISGRAPRSEYWFFYLSLIILGFVASIMDSALGIPLFTLIFVLVAIVPFFCVTVRRLHDRSMSGWMMLVYIVPIIGSILMLVLTCLPSEPGDNRFGPNPLGE